MRRWLRSLLMHFSTSSGRTACLCVCRVADSASSAGKAQERQQRRRDLPTALARSLSAPPGFQRALPAETGAWRASCVALEARRAAESSRRQGDGTRSAVFAPRRVLPTLRAARRGATGSHAAASAQRAALLLRTCRYRRATGHQGFACAVLP